jgi:hypothetical protein
MNEPSQERPKIIVDEDWKSQVEREREQVKAAPTPSSGPTEVDVHPPLENLPPPTFELLLSTFATQALVYLGQIPDPETNRPSIRLDLAQHQIDMLAMLESKTAGNLSEAEAKLLEDILHQLRMAFVTIREQVERAR